MARSETYVSVDIEADGPIPGPHSMLSLGAAAFVAHDEAPQSTFSVNLETLEGATADPRTARWWEGQPEAWAACRADPQPIEPAMRAFRSWLLGLEGRPVFVAYPAGFDFTFVYWYLVRFTGDSPFSFSALDMKTFAMATLDIPYRDAVKRRFPKRWLPEGRHTHVALDDAIEQGITFVRMLAYRRGER